MCLPLASRPLFRPYWFLFLWRRTTPHPPTGFVLLRCCCWWSVSLDSFSPLSRICSSSSLAVAVQLWSSSRKMTLSSFPVTNPMDPSVSRTQRFADQFVFFSLGAPSKKIQRTLTLYFTYSSLVSQSRYTLSSQRV